MPEQPSRTASRSLSREPSAPAPEPTPAVDVAGLAQAYGRSLYAALNSKTRDSYPLSARRMNQSGVVYLTLLVDEAGRIIESQVKHSSGVASLDEAALALVRTANELPVPPSQLGWKRKRVTVPLRYVLD